MKRAFALLVLAMLAGCGSDKGEEQDAGQPGAAAQTDKPKTLKAPGLQKAETTPNKDRVATLGLLNKRNNLTQDIVLKTGESREVGNVTVKLESCERTLPWESVKETGAFVKVSVFERPGPGKDPVWNQIFSGWLFKNSPSVNVVEHPIYDVWVKDCAMNFPGEEAKPAAAQSR